ncbi:MAG: phosphatase PAP2 family protein [Roseimicrobium sp.]
MTLDDTISRTMANLLGRAPGFDALVLTVSASNLLKGAVLLAAASCFWLAPGAGFAMADRARLVGNRAILASALLASCLGEVIALALAKLAPFRLRPFLHEDLAMPVPQGLQDLAPRLMEQSSFPSDHADLFFAMATGLWLVHRRAGWLAYAYVTVIIALPRLYLGLHFATDLVVGGAIGVAVALAGVRLLANRTLMQRLAALTLERPAIANPVLFLIAFQIATMLGDLRDFADLAGRLSGLDNDGLRTADATVPPRGPQALLP